jgi:hypothetical protein
VALANSQLEAIADDGVRFHYRDSKTGRLRRLTLPPEVFLGRFLQHVLPRGFTKVRSYGLAAPRNAAKLAAAREQAAAVSAGHATGSDAATSDAPASGPSPPERAPAPRRLLRCPACGASMRCLGRLPPHRGPP